MQVVPFIANAFTIFLFYQYFKSIPKELTRPPGSTAPAGSDLPQRRDAAGRPGVATVAILKFLPPGTSTCGR